MRRKHAHPRENFSFMLNSATELCQCPRNLRKSRGAIYYSQIRNNCRSQLYKLFIKRRLYVTGRIQTGAERLWISDVSEDLV